VTFGKHLGAAKLICQNPGFFFRFGAHRSHLFGFFGRLIQATLLSFLAIFLSLFGFFASHNAASRQSLRDGFRQKKLEVDSGQFWCDWNAILECHGEKTVAMHAMHSGIVEE